MAGLLWRAGVDIGLNSVGLAAVEVDLSGAPVRILNMQSVIHDSGVGRDGAKTATTRLAISGVARRHRRLMARRRKRLEALNRWIVMQGWPLIDPSEQTDPYWPWTVRAALASTPIVHDAERAAMLSVALRHMARHRGWRSPWMPVEALMDRAEPSKDFVAMQQRFAAATDSAVNEDATPAQIIVARGLSPEYRIRTRGAKDGVERPGLLGSRLHQSDYASELRVIAEMQGLRDDITKQMIRLVFAAKSPRGSNLQRVGSDPLAPGTRRASKASLTFQRYRIVTILANLRVRETNSSAARPLSAAEIQKTADYLWNMSPKDDPTWSDVATLLGVDRQRLRGTAAVTEDGERAPARPPVNVTDRVMRTLSVAPVAAWWHGASDSERSALLERLSGDTENPDGSRADAAVEELFASLSEGEQTMLADIKALPAGRATYSEETLGRITDRILATGEDLRHARQSEFGLTDEWTPPVDPIGHPVGNPGVDRATKVIARWLVAMEAEFGAPVNVNVGHVRKGLVSARAAREMDRANQARRRATEKMQLQMVAEGLAVSVETIRREEMLRYRTFARQNGQCLYCGHPIEYAAFEMDHVVPRKGRGSSNRRGNLAAVCRRCRQLKGCTPFAIWAEGCGLEGVTLHAAQDRVRRFRREPGDTMQRHRRFMREFDARLSRKSADDEIDGRRMESVASMAHELHRRIDHHFKSAGSDTGVAVYKGRLAAEARKASGVDDRIELAGGPGNRRLDRRHHAVDALVMSMISPSIATVLAHRIALRGEERVTRANETWTTFRGNTQAGRVLYSQWLGHMTHLTEMLHEALTDDHVIIRQNVRLRLGDGKAHGDTIRALGRKRVGDALPMSLIDRAASPALWCALTRARGFDPHIGLRADPTRRIVVRGTHLGPEDEIAFMPGKAAGIAVRGGFAEIGDAIHHARIYRIDGTSPAYAMLRVFQNDLLRHRGEDLFSTSIPLQSISMRTAESKLRTALAANAARLVGWLVVGDELLLDMTEFAKGTTAVSRFMHEYPRTARWVLDGFYSASQLRLRPRYLSAEGLHADIADHVRKIVDLPGWRPAVNALFKKAAPRVIRRDTLGRPRLVSAAHLPVSWQADHV